MVARATRAALAEALAAGAVQRAQIYALAECGGRSFAMGSAPIEVNRQEGSPALPSCGDSAPALSDARSPCRGWTQRIVWEDGDSRLAVGAAQGIRSRNLAEKTAFGRALSHLATAEGEARMSAQRTNMAQCSKTTFVQVRVKREPL